MCFIIVSMYHCNGGRLHEVGGNESEVILMLYLSISPLSIIEHVSLQDRNKLLVRGHMNIFAAINLQMSTLRASENVKEYCGIV